MPVDYSGERKVREDAPYNHVQHRHFKDPERPCGGWAVMDWQQARKVWIMDDLLAYTEAGEDKVEEHAESGAAPAPSPAAPAWLGGAPSLPACPGALTA